jgi:hypothetical protein
MRRGDSFRPERQPLSNHPGWKLGTEHVSGPISFLNPTTAHFHPTDALVTKRGPAEDQEQEKEPRSPGKALEEIPHIHRLWRSRDNRKGRHALQVHLRSPGPQGEALPRRTSTLSATWKGILRMFTHFPYWDVSYLVATVFTFGSMVWVINAFFVWLPLVDPSSEFANESLTGGGITACIGATIFEVGSVLLLLEAANEHQTGCFGWALETVLEQAHGDIERAMFRLSPSAEACHHHHANRKSFLRRPERNKPTVKSIETANAKYNGVSDHGGVTKSWITSSSSDGRSFKWLPTLTELRTHYLHELGFLASLVQFIGASIFWISGFTGLPGIINHMSQGLTDGIYWVPQMVGGFCFITSGLLFTIETQPKWYIPAPRVLGWNVGFWNFIGGIGFMLCGALGPGTANSRVQYQATLSTFWGSWAFLIGSTIQWYESLDKYPVEDKT